MDGYLKSFLGYLVFWGCVLYLCVLVAHPELMCIENGCAKRAKEGSSYCDSHAPRTQGYKAPVTNYTYSGRRSSSKTSSAKTNSYSSKSSSIKISSDSTKKYSSSSVPTTKKSTASKKTYNAYDSYDAGYEDVYENDDFDWDRYYSDDDYADGVDDAMDELDW